MVLMTLCPTSAMPVRKAVSRGCTSRSVRVVTCQANNRPGKAPAAVAAAAAALLLMSGSPAMNANAAPPTYMQLGEFASLQSKAENVLEDAKEGAADVGSSIKRGAKKAVRQTKEQLPTDYLDTDAPQGRGTYTGILLFAGSIAFLAYLARNPGDQLAGASRRK